MVLRGLREFAPGVCVCVESATPRGGEEEGEEEVLRRLVTPKGVGGFNPQLSSPYVRLCSIPMLRPMEEPEARTIEWDIRILWRN